jgi:hypothetical protein
MHCLDERGAGLVIAILTVVALFALGTTLVFLTRTDVNISKHQTLHVEALYVAEAGVEEALQRLSLPDPTNVTVNGSSINAAIRDPANPPDPDWEARIFLCRPGAEPAATGTDYHTCTIQDADSWLEYSSEDDLTTALTIRHKWQDLDDDGVREVGEIVLYDGGKYPPQNFTTGTPVEVLTITAKSATAEREIEVEATRYPLNVNVRAALLCDMGVDIKGNVTICGHDHDMMMPHYTMLPGCMNWEYCNNRTNCLGTGCLIGVMTTGDEIDRRGSTDLAGNPAPEDSSSSNQFYTLAETLGISQADVDEILANADYHNVGEASPQDGITYVNNAGGGEAQWAGDGVGSGLLYVTGDLATIGNFQWKGLIYVEGDYKITGTPSIIGAVIVKGRSEYAFSGGNPGILFSSEAIDYYIRQHLGYIRIGWKETSGV